jgi:hypothetical protein
VFEVYKSVENQKKQVWTLINIAYVSGYLSVSCYTRGSSYAALNVLGRRGPRPSRIMQTFRSSQGQDNGAEAQIVCGRNE